MRKIILLLTVFFVCLGTRAQEATTDYIYSSDGFELKTGVIEQEHSDGEKFLHRSQGLYSKDGKMLVSAIACDLVYVRDGSRYTFYVIDGCETICSGAFQGLNMCTVYIPSSVKYIAPNALISYKSARDGHANGFGGIQDGCMEEGASSVSSPAVNENTTEVARYNMQGIKLNEPTNGINIIRQSDGTTEKVLVK